MGIGQEGIGKGRIMFQECLAEKRSVLFPSQANGFARLAFRIAGAYSLISNPFDETRQGQEGIEEILARIGGYTYIIEASRKYTLGALDQGIIPQVASTILQYNSATMIKKIIDNTMDILGSKAIMRGPKNLIAAIYISLPVNSNLDEPNFFLRNSLFFLQTLHCSHPYFAKEMAAIKEQDSILWDKLFFRHVFSFIKNAIQYFLYSISRGYLALVPGSYNTKPFYRKLSCACSAFSLLTDINILTYMIKEKTHNMAKLSDILSHLYLSICILKRYESEGEKKEDLPLVQWSMDYCLFHIQNALESILKGFQLPFLGFFLKYPLFWWMQFHSIRIWNHDLLEKQIAQIMQTPGDQRNRLAENVYMPQNVTQPLAQLEKTFEVAWEAKKIHEKIQTAVQKKILPPLSLEDLEKIAPEANIITEEESEILYKFYCERNDFLQIDSFSRSE